MDTRELQLYKLDILRDVTQFCDDNKIKYVLAFGTLLGAIRHSGFIPWDDDIDIAMPWADYKRFNKLAKSKLPKRYFVQNYLTDPAFPMMYTQIRVNGTTSMPVKSFKLKTHWGICIDVLPMIGLCNTKIGLSLQQKCLTICNSLLITEHIHASAMEACGMQRVINTIPRRIRKIIVQILIHTACFMGALQKNGFCVYCSDIHNHGLINDWFERIHWTFENDAFWIPKAYDSILTRIYNDYMTPPPLDLQTGHDATLGEQIIDFDNDYSLYQQRLQNQ